MDFIPDCVLINAVKRCLKTGNGAYDTIEWLRENWYDFSGSVRKEIVNIVITDLKYTNVKNAIDWKAFLTYITNNNLKLYHEN